MMTTTRIIAQASDILGLVITCRHCQTETRLALNSDVVPTGKCPACRAEWWDNVPGLPNVTLDALHALRKLQAVQQQPKQHIRLHLELAPASSLPASQ